MTEKKLEKYRLVPIILICFISITLIGISIYGARPKQYNVSNKIMLEQGVENEENISNKALKKEFDEYKKELKDNYKETIESMNTKFNLIISLLGVAVTVWVGLNIYNVIQRDAIEKIKNDMDKYKKIQEKLNDDRDNLKENIEKFKLELDNIIKEKNSLINEVKELNCVFNKTLSSEISKINDDFNKTLNNEVTRVSTVFNDTLGNFEKKIMILKNDEEKLRVEVNNFIQSQFWINIMNSQKKD